ncbi:MAG TPA: Sec-independent protein translocase protein TatB [Rhizomicrobium sp.]|jgi:sec-independent protein translocase protein TatB|nr:Sec-independent protein translocase protein TatB [Rhizomicrobium sp.]
MFDLSWSHILIVLVVALIVVGPKDLPRLMRIVGGWVGKARGMANEFRKSFDEMARQSELDELRQEIESLRNARPLADLESELHQSILPPDDLPPSAAARSVTEAGAAAAHVEETPPEPNFRPGDVPPAP